MSTVMKKAESLEYWRNLVANQNPLKHMSRIPYKTPGAKFGNDGIRIDGSPEFIDAVLSNLKDLLDGENGVTRLELSRVTVEPREGRDNCYPHGAQVCYIRLHERGREAQMMSAFIAGARRQTANVFGS